MTEKKFIQIAERLGWSVTKDRYDIELQFYTDYGQDFSFSVNRNECYVKQVYDYYNSFDPDEEALLLKDESISLDERLVKAHRVFDSQGHSGMSASLMFSMLCKFCPDGEKLVEYLRK